MINIIHLNIAFHEISYRKYMVSLYPKINRKIKVSTLWNNRCLSYYIVENYDRVPDYNQLMFKLKTMYPDIILCE